VDEYILALRAPRPTLRPKSGRGNPHVTLGNWGIGDYGMADS